MKYNTIFMYDTCTYDMYNYDIKYNVEFLKEEYKSNIRKLVRLLALWHANLKHWHAVRHVGTFIVTLARKIEKLARFWHVATKARWHASRLTRIPRCHAGTCGTRFSKLLKKLCRPATSWFQVLSLRILSSFQEQQVYREPVSRSF